jgi:hypothetical protein
LEDSEPGVPEEALSMLFDRLFRADASRSRDSGGSNNTNTSDDTRQDTADDTGQNPPAVPAPGSGTAVVLAANDLGMHCMDREFSVFSILPPFNVIHAQVLNRNSPGAPQLLDDNSIDVRYGGISDALGSINTYSVAGPLAKTDFWNWADQLFGTSFAIRGEQPKPVSIQQRARWYLLRGLSRQHPRHLAQWRSRRKRQCGRL